jgi:hypothetical protein
MTSKQAAGLQTNPWSLELETWNLNFNIFRFHVSGFRFQEPADQRRILPLLKSGIKLWSQKNSPLTLKAKSFK